MALRIRQDGGRILLKVKVVPASSRTAIAGEMEGVLKVKVQAPPEKGKANAALQAFLADKLGVRKNAVAIVAGATGPLKEVAVQGVRADTAREKLAGK